MWVHLTLFSIILMLFSQATATRAPTPCGKFNIQEITTSENYHLKYRNNGNNVLASAINCHEYEEHLKSEAISIKESILLLQQKYEKKIQEYIKLKRGELKNRKNLASSYSCDYKTGLWKLNREAAFKCTPKAMQFDKEKIFTKLAVDSMDIGSDLVVKGEGLDRAGI